jgi:hypothetical protein
MIPSQSPSKIKQTKSYRLKMNLKTIKFLQAFPKILIKTSLTFWSISKETNSA